jgi:hypothetical protein
MMQRIPNGIAKEAKEELQKLSWNEIRPGVFKRELEWFSYVVKEQKYHCQECKDPNVWAMGFMVIDSLWKQVCPNNGMICLICFEKLLGRQLIIDEFKDVPLNAYIKYLLRTRS